jgi:hypothetical protein
MKYALCVPYTRYASSVCCDDAGVIDDHEGTSGYACCC